MKNRLRKCLVVSLCFVLGITFNTMGQSMYKISKGSTMKLSGTSTLHNWTMNASTFEGEAPFGFKAGKDHQLTNLQSLTFTLAVLNLKSGEKALDKNAYKALKTDRFKNIAYKLISADISPEEGDKYSLKTHGNLTIAGITKPVDINVHCMVNPDGSITCKGTDQLNLTDYEVKPPSFMLGAMKTGDAVTLDFTLVYRKGAD